MKSPSQVAYEKVQARLAKAPGMIEESERRLLFEAAFNSNGLPIVEFGAFFGASTVALACGAAARTTGQVPIFCIDAFEVDNDHNFHKYVLGYAQSVKPEKLLIKNNGKTNWLQITKAVLGKEQKMVNIIQGLVDNKFDMTQLPPKIGLLHLDLPKDAQTLIPILKGAFPRLTDGSMIAFQDYAYQLSNELISFFEILEKQKYIKPISIAASSMFYEVCTNKMKEIDLLNLLTESMNNQEILIRDAITKYSSYSTARGQESIALYGAVIRSIIAQKDSGEFQQKEKIQKVIEKMYQINPSRAAFVLSDLITEDIEQHR